MKKERKFTKSEIALLKVARNMPPLYNTKPGEKFEIEKSEVAQWLIKQPEAMMLVLNFVCRRKHDKVVELDAKSGKWHGIDYSQDEFDGVFGKCSICNDRTCASGYCSWDE